MKIIFENVSRVLLVVLFTAGCASVPKKSASQFYNIQMTGFLYNAKSPEKAQYIMTLKRLQPDKEKLYLEAEFQNPCGEEVTIIKPITVMPFQEEVSFRSPDVRCLKSGEYYRVNVKTFDSLGKNKVLDDFTQKVYSNLDAHKISEMMLEKSEVKDDH